MTIAPLAYLSFQYTLRQVVDFIRALTIHTFCVRRLTQPTPDPLIPSLGCYTIGLVFYATQFPECYLSSRWEHSRLLDWIGGGSHAIWHVFIVAAIAMHMGGMSQLKAGISQCQ